MCAHFSNVSPLRALEKHVPAAVAPSRLEWQAPLRVEKLSSQLSSLSSVDREREPERYEGGWGITWRWARTRQRVRRAR